MKARTVIVDDSSMSRRIVRGYLDSAGRDVTEASDGTAALGLNKPIRREELLTAVNSGLRG